MPQNIAQLMVDLTMKLEELDPSRNPKTYRTLQEVLSETMAAIAELDARLAALERKGN